MQRFRKTAIPQRESVNDKAANNKNLQQIETSEQKLTLNITYYSTFQSASNISQEFNSLLVFRRDHKKVFLDALDVTWDCASKIT